MPRARPRRRLLVATRRAAPDDNGCRDKNHGQRRSLHALFLTGDRAAVGATLSVHGRRRMDIEDGDLGRMPNATMKAAAFAGRTLSSKNRTLRPGLRGQYETRSGSPQGHQPSTSPRLHRSGARARYRGRTARTRPGTAREGPRGRSWRPEAGPKVDRPGPSRRTSRICESAVDPLANRPVIAPHADSRHRSKAKPTAPSSPNGNPTAMHVGTMPGGDTARHVS